MNPQTAQHCIQHMTTQLARVIVGQPLVIQQVITAVCANGHVLLEGAPGLAKTTLVRTLAHLLGLSFGRVQCTPDLMPSDVIGTMMLFDSQPGQYALRFAPGPIFASLVLVDEINRTTPRTQSALLEAMQEHTVTVAGTTHVLPDPFLVLATQNPIEMEGTYPLPEAQRDRFLYQINVPFPAVDDLVEIARREALAAPIQSEILPSACTLHEIRSVCQQMLVSDALLHYVALLVRATHPDHSPVAAVRDLVRYGASPRAVQAIVRTAQVQAMCAGRLHVDVSDVHQVLLPTLRHRIVLRREALLSHVGSDALINEIMTQVPLP
ncbi:MAG: AAA family ATPase [Roseiflexaceae bacterium]|jgi:MoxR-like ATPase